jgi:hypothetical protein
MPLLSRYHYLKNSLPARSKTLLATPIENADIEFSITVGSHGRAGGTFADTTCQCDRLLHADTDFFFKFGTDVAERFFQCGG